MRKSNPTNEQQSTANMYINGNITSKHVVLFILLNIEIANKIAVLYWTVWYFITSVLCLTDWWYEDFKVCFVLWTPPCEPNCFKKMLLSSQIWQILSPRPYDRTHWCYNSEMNISSLNTEYIGQLVQNRSLTHRLSALTNNSAHVGEKLYKSDPDLSRNRICSTDSHNNWVPFIVFVFFAYFPYFENIK
jgi:hypothetical protein